MTLVVREEASSAFDAENAADMRSFASPICMRQILTSTEGQGSPQDQTRQRKSLAPMAPLRNLLAITGTSSQLASTLIFLGQSSY
jgi:hypothetical protein